MKYEDVFEGRFISRPNRFIANVELDGVPQVCHVKNTGRCRELLVPGAKVWVQRSKNPQRRTKYDLICVRKGDILINMDSAAPNGVFGEYLAGGGLLPSPTLIRPETVFGDSRFDFYLESGGRRAFCEVKGVTLEDRGIVRFPDAPTVRGAKHMRELARCVRAGYEAYAVFIAQLENAIRFEPNSETDPDFALALREAALAGVDILCLKCRVAPDRLEIAGPVEITI